MVDISITLKDRTYEKLKLICEKDGLDFYEFISDCIDDAVNTRLYGDMNEMMGLNKEKESKTEEKPMEKLVEVEKKMVDKPIVVTDKPTETVDNNPKPRKIRRTIKVKTND